MEDDDDELLSELAFTLEEDQDEKLAQEREKLQRSDSASSNEYDSQVKLQQAMLRRQELLDKIRQEQLLNDEERRPRTYTPRRRYTPSPLPPPSRRSLPDLNRNYHFNWYTKRPRVSDMAVSKHVIEHQFRPMESKTYTVLPPISTNAQVVPQVTLQTPPVIQQVPVVPYDGGQQNKNTFFNKSGISKADFMDMMMLQNAQMHHMVMQQMMLQNLPGGGYRMPTATVPLAPVVEPAVRAAPMLTYGAPAAPVIHHYQSVPPMDVRGGGFGGGRGANMIVRKGVQNRPPNNGPIIVRTDAVRNSRKYSSFPGSKALCRFRHVAWAAWAIAILRALAKKNKGNRPSSVFLFGIILKEIVAALHRVYLNPSGNIYPVMGDIIGSGAQDLSQLVGERGRVAEDESVRLFQILQYVMENLIYHITEIMPKTGVLGTHKKAAVFELIKNGKRFPDGYFWQIELDRLQFNNNGRTMNVGDKEAFLLLVGMFLSRSLITTLLMKPVDYGLSTEQLTEVAERNLKVLSTVMLFLVRRVSTPPDAPMMPMPGEVARYVFSDEEMRNVHLRLRRSYEYCENLLREWGAEYIRRLRDAAVNSTKK
ncbi:uncharacterized protein LOC112557888 isoform X2 [Pomacea canaliculata]|uniref:uncharacterized protein LOC112557888 isoform X2 n=1 Tax=Pomacea canaliculata TaxID=400727 RepID=UPI000D7310F7|nr:uncharacterized protein LOC112557888 isoform X2 [Pomacea canaliculata]